MNLGLLTNNIEEIITPPKTFSYAIEFDGVNDFISAGSFPDYQQNYLTSPFEAGDWTIEHWLKDFGNNNPSISVCLFFTSHLRTWIYRNTHFQSTHRKTDGYWEDWHVLIPTTLNRANWTHFVVRYTAATKTREMFLNNVLIGSTVSAKYPAETNSTVGIGSSSLGTALYRGKMDDMRVYKRALSNEEIAQSYNSGFGNLPVNPTDLIYWISFEMCVENWGSRPLIPRMGNFTDNPFILR